ncbi:MAG: tig [Thermoleophilia bacterium]|nr:tig [Thermoleophilia bacterium]
MLNTTIERLDDNKLRLDVEVPQQVLRGAIDDTLVYMGRELNIPGFRPGKVPPQAVMARLGREAVVGETIRVFIDDWYRAAVVSSGVRPVAQPEIEFDETEAGSGLKDAPLRFSATVEVAPKPKLPELSTLEVDRPNLPDTKKYVDQVLEATLRGAGTLNDVTRPAQEGDEVVVDFRCTIDGEEVAGAAATGYQARLGDGRLLAELETAILGSEADAEVEVPVDFPADHPMPQLAGKNATFHLKVNSVQELELPELTDEVAAQVSEFGTKAELLANIEEGIVERLEGEVAGIFRGNAVEALAKAAELEEPQSLVESRQQELYGGLKQQLEQAGLSMEQYLDRSGRDTTELFAELAVSAREDLRRELVLLALAEDAKIVVSEDDLLREVAEHAAQTGQEPDAAFQQVLSSGRADLLRGELLIQRTIDHLVATVKPKPVDLPTAEEAAEAAAANNEEPVEA